MKKLILAVALAAGTLSVAIPAQAATVITPEWNEDWVVAELWFDTYPPQFYYNVDTGYSGQLQRVYPQPGGGYVGVYYGSWL
ncbi:hypothetical protein EV586_103286 [Tumebacillus sp. BK434]|uniref:hypothetical protein n=1 Tax=Tumebacillus sp. BK434 TaxID=2512169 RepID=UPI001047B2E9|nr:hypothetical protein [Tumebacillus sp. BK434]TCP55633.1 hypothetical protein EV586_103286 [Tumebacillus sp. BK434]